MENRQNMIKQASEDLSQYELKSWSQYLCSPAFSRQILSEQAPLIVQRILLAMSEGDSCVERLADDVEHLADLALSEQQLSRQHIAPIIYDEQYLYLYRYWALENSLAQQVLRLSQQQISAIDIQESTSLLSDPYQKQALAIVAHHALSLITGGPGTGKTYTLARIIAVLQQAQPGLRIALAAPTGKAAQRMKEALQNSFSDQKLASFLSAEMREITPITIHRLLGLGHRHQAKFNQQQPLPYDLIVIDEASMLDLSLANMLFCAIADQTRLILLGDAQQLASVDVGNVLADLQAIPDLAKHRVNLLTSRRFKEGALIGKMAQFIQQQSLANSAQVLPQFEQQIVQAGQLKPITLQPDMPDIIQLQYLADQQGKIVDYSCYYDQLFLGFSDYVQAIQRYLNHEAIHLSDIVQAFDAYRILTAIRHSALGLISLNKQMEQRLLEQSQQRKQGDWYIGRPVMMSYNDYQLGLSNGDIGICLKLDDVFQVYFPSLEKWVLATRLPKNIETAYVLTIHKSQGSEFKHTAVVLDEMATQLLSKELIYTAITRAKSVVSLLVHRDAFQAALTKITNRNSGLLSKFKKLL